MFQRETISPKSLLFDQDCYHWFDRCHHDVLGIWSFIRFCVSSSVIVQNREKPITIGIMASMVARLSVVTWKFIVWMQLLFVFKLLLWLSFENCDKRSICVTVARTSSCFTRATSPILIMPLVCMYAHLLLGIGLYSHLVMPSNRDSTKISHVQDVHIASPY